MKKLFITLFYFCTVCFTTLSQQVAVVKSEPIYSQILQQNRELLIYLPESYTENTYTHYDVIYVFDAENRELFDYVHAILRFLNTDEKQFIIVGITSPYNEELDYARNNDMLPAPRYTAPEKFYNGYSGNADNFLEFVDKEVLKYIESNYRTLGNTIAIGHSLSASLVLYSIIRKPNLFNDIIAISPNLAFDNERLVEDILGYDYTVLSPKGFLYTSLADEGIDYWKPWRPAYDKVQRFISDSLQAVFEYKFEEFPSMNHNNTYPVSVESALKEYFNYYSKYRTHKLSNNSLEVRIKVSVPSRKDEVYITGNQAALSNWDPHKRRMHKLSDFEREITLNVQLPAEFKFTRGNWDTEALVKGSDGMGSIAIVSDKKREFVFEIVNWIDMLE